MNLVHNGPSNGWLSDAAKPLPDPMLTSHQYAPLCLISMQVMTYIDDDDNFECILFKMSPGLNELTNLSGKALYILLTLTWDTFMEFPLTGSQLINPGLEFFCSKINCPLSRHSLCSALANVPHRLFPCLYAPFVRLYIVDQTQGSIGWFRCLPPFLRLTKQAGTPGFLARPAGVTVCLAAFAETQLRYRKRSCAQLVQLRAANAASAARALIRSTIGSMGPQKPNEQYIERR